MNIIYPIEQIDSFKQAEMITANWTIGLFHCMNLHIVYQMCADICDKFSGIPFNGMLSMNAI